MHKIIEIPSEYLANPLKAHKKLREKVNTTLLEISNISLEELVTSQKVDLTLTQLKTKLIQKNLTYNPFDKNSCKIYTLIQEESQKLSVKNLISNIETIACYMQPTSIIQNIQAYIKINLLNLELCVPQCKRANYWKYISILKSRISCLIYSSNNLEESFEKKVLHSEYITLDKLYQSLQSITPDSNRRTNHKQKLQQLLLAINVLKILCFIASKNKTNHTEVIFFFNQQIQAIKFIESKPYSNRTIINQLITDLLHTVIDDVSEAQITGFITYKQITRSNNNQDIIDKIARTIKNLEKNFSSSQKNFQLLSQMHLLIQREILYNDFNGQKENNDDFLMIGEIGIEYTIRNLRNAIINYKFYCYISEYNPEQFKKDLEELTNMIELFEAILCFYQIINDSYFSSQPGDTEVDQAYLRDGVQLLQRLKQFSQEQEEIINYHLNTIDSFIEELNPIDPFLLHQFFQGLENVLANLNLVTTQLVIELEDKYKQNQDPTKSYAKIKVLYFMSFIRQSTCNFLLDMNNTNIMQSLSRSGLQKQDAHNHDHTITPKKNKKNRGKHHTSKKKKQHNNKNRTSVAKSNPNYEEYSSDTITTFPLTSPIINPSNDDPGHSDLDSDSDDAITSLKNYMIAITQHSRPEPKIEQYVDLIFPAQDSVQAETQLTDVASHKTDSPIEETHSNTVSLPQPKTSEKMIRKSQPGHIKKKTIEITEVTMMHSHHTLNQKKEPKETSEHFTGKQLKSRNFMKVLRELGFHPDHVTGSHAIMKKESQSIPVPLHSTLALGTARSIMRQAKK